MLYFHYSWNDTKKNNRFQIVLTVLLRPLVFQQHFVDKIKSQLNYDNNTFMLLKEVAQSSKLPNISFSHQVYFSKIN